MSPGILNCVPLDRLEDEQENCKEFVRREILLCSVTFKTEFMCQQNCSPAKSDIDTFYNTNISFYAVLFLC